MQEVEQPQKRRKKRGRGRTVVRPLTPDHAPLTTARGENYGPPVVPSVWRGPGTSRTMHFELLWTPGFALNFHVLGLLGLLFNLSSLGLASTHIFHPKCGLNDANLQSQLNKAKTERNRRNSWINRKLMQINPKFQA